MKRTFDIVISLLGLSILSPILWIFVILIWLQDFHSPFYVAPRVGRNGKLFRMVKLRSMVAYADKSGVDSTSTDDIRITWVGHIIRRYKLDEFSQLWNVLKGYLSLVGPRPNVQRDVALYTAEERHLIDIRPGITDISSIVFSDEGDILSGSDDPDLKYNQVIRPWKSRLGLLYVKKRWFFLDLQLIFLTVTAILSKKKALLGVQNILKQLKADNKLLDIASRQKALEPYPPPGSDKIVMNRDSAL